MIKPPKSNISIAMYLLSLVFVIGCAFALFNFAQLPGGTRPGTIAKIAVLGSFRFMAISALATFLAGHVIQLVRDIRWQLYQDGTNA